MENYPGWICHRKRRRVFLWQYFDKNENGEYRGADTMHLSVTEFNDWVKSIKEIA